MPTESLKRLAAEVFAQCSRKQLKIVMAESCTGGLVSAVLTDVPGMSAVFDRGFVTYSNESKIEMLGVPAALITKQGAVSEDVARAMAQGALSRSKADIAVAITGIAGPDGGTKEKPVGLVYLAAARKGKDTLVEKQLFTGVREDVRESAAMRALEMITLSA